MRLLTILLLMTTHANAHEYVFKHRRAYDGLGMTHRSVVTYQPSAGFIYLDDDGVPPRHYPRPCDLTTYTDSLGVTRYVSDQTNCNR